MTSLANYMCALVLTGGLATPAFAAQGDAGSGPTAGATATNDAGSGPTKGAPGILRAQCNPAQQTRMRIPPRQAPQTCT